MSKCVLPVFTESSYTLSSWYKKTIAGIESEASKHQLQTQQYADSYGIPCTHNLPDVVIVTAGKADWTRNILSALNKIDKKIVLAGIEPENFGDNISGVTFNRRHSMEKILSYFHACGRKKIALFGFNKNSSNDILRCDAFLNISKDLGIAASNKDIFISNEYLTACFNIFMESYRNYKNYDAVICPNDIIAFFFIVHAKKLGIRIPDDIYVTGFSNMLISRFCSPDITTFTHNYYEVGIQSVNAWLFLMKNPSVVSIKLTTTDDLIIRGSTAKIVETAATHSPQPVKLEDERFFSDPAINEILNIENCMLQCDSLDGKIIDGIMMGKSYETLADELFTSLSTIRYRAGRIYHSAKVSGRNEFENLIKQYAGNNISSIISAEES